MFKHHLKIAFRNLLKNKSQNIISIVGLAMGFICFSFSVLWIRYETSYDNFHSKADRIYRVNTMLYRWDAVNFTGNNTVSNSTSYPEGNWLKFNFPEIEDATTVRLENNVGDHNFSVIWVDSSFGNIFDVELPEDFFIQGRTDSPVALIDELNNETIEKLLKEEYKWDVLYTIPAWPKNTNIQYDIIVPVYQRFTEEHINHWHLPWFDTYILLREGADIDALIEKLNRVESPRRTTPISYVLTPLKILRHNDPTGNIGSDIKYSHIRVFAIAGLLVIVCSLLNLLILYVNHARIRLRELALRKVNGATDWQIATTLSFDFMLVILLSLAIGFIFIFWLLPVFKDFAAIESANISIYTELLLYAILLILFGFAASGVLVLFFRKQVLNESIKGSGKPGSGKIFRRASLSLQLIISLAMIFCAIIIIKQLRFLHHVDLGFNRHNIAAVSLPCCQLEPYYADIIKQIPGVVDALPVINSNFLRNMRGGSQQMRFEKDGEQLYATIFWISTFSNFFDFFEIEIIEGTRFSDYDPAHRHLVNEAVLRELQDVVSVGRIQYIGVTRDFYLTPTEKVRPTMINFAQGLDDLFRAVAYKYEEGTRTQTEQTVSRWLREEFEDRGEIVIDFLYMEDIFEEYFKSDRALLTFLSLMTLACILIAVFGVYSQTKLTCQQRRKEIAIRKVNGAEIVDIMNIFFLEYLIILAFAALIAFPAGFLLMKRWLEDYVKQTSMDAWIFVAIFMAVFVVIVFSIFSTVWKAANQDPAEVLSK